MYHLSPDDSNSEPSDSNLPLAEIVARAFQKDREAFTMLYDYYRKPLGKYLLYKVNNQETAHDLYQETFIRVWRYVSNPTRKPFDVAVERFERWLYRVARNLAIDHLRHEGKLQFLQFPEDEPDKPLEYGLFMLLRRKGYEEKICEQICIEQAIEAMSPQYRTCLLLQVHMGYSQREIAKLLGISEQAVSTNVIRGYKQFRLIYNNLIAGRPPKANEEGS